MNSKRNNVSLAIFSPRWYLSSNSLSHSMSNMCNRTEGLHFQCPPSRRWNSSSSKRLTPDHCPSTRGCQFHCRHSNSQSHSARTHATGKSGTGEQKWLRAFPSSRCRRVDKALSQARDGSQTTVRQVKVARFTGECIYLQIHGLTQFRTRDRLERHWEGLHFQCTSSRRRDSIASKKWSPAEAAGVTVDIQIHSLT